MVGNSVWWGRPRCGGETPLWWGDPRCGGETTVVGRLRCGEENLVGNLNPKPETQAVDQFTFWEEAKNQQTQRTSLGKWSRL